MPPAQENLQCLAIFMVVTTWNGRDDIATPGGTEQVTKHPECTGSPPQPRIMRPECQQCKR